MIEKWIEDTPSRVVFWRDTKADYSISLLLNENGKPDLKIWGAAWQDDEPTLTRHLLQLDARTLEAPVAAGQLGDALDQLGNEAEERAHAGKWSQDVPLPAHPADVPH